MLETIVTTAMLAVVSLPLLAVVNGCGVNPLKPAEKITIAVVPWPASASLYVAHEKGYFRAEGLDDTLDSYISGHLGVDAVLTGKADLAAAGDTPITQAAVSGKPLAVIATVSEIERAISIIARKDRGISAPDDLRGKKIGRVAGSTADFFLYDYLVTSYINPEDVQVVDIAADKVVDVLLSGEVDAVSTWSPHTLVLRDKLGSNAVVLQRSSIYRMTWNIVTTQEFASNNPERIKRFLRAVIRANAFINEHPDEARTISAKYIGTDSPLYEREWPDYSFTATLSESLVLNMQNQAQWMAGREASGDQGLPDFLDFIYSDGLRAVWPEAVTIAGK